MISLRTRYRHRPLVFMQLAAGAALLALAFPGVGLAATAPLLGAASSFSVLGGQTVTNTKPSVLAGEVGVSHGTAITGFPLGTAGAQHAGDTVAGQAQAAVTAAYLSLDAEKCDQDLSGTDLGGMSLGPGVYCFSSSAHLTGPLTLDAHGDANAVFVFKTVSTLTTGSGAIVQLINGASPCNVFWKIGSSATLGTGTIFVGNILALTMITVTTGTVVHGRALARNDAVTLDSSTFLDDGCLSGGTTGIPIVTVVPPPSGATPELNTLLLFGAGALGLGAYARTPYIIVRIPLSVMTARRWKSTRGWSEGE